ncbi:MAG: hypothetical protein ACYC5Y_14000 [Symbiobacteriia bacterium]
MTDEAKNPRTRAEGLAMPYWGGSIVFVAALSIAVIIPMGFSYFEYQRLHRCPQ